MFQYSTYDLSEELINRGFPVNVDTFTGIIKCHTTNKISFYKNGKLHRLDGPACEWLNGTKEWWIEGKQHRFEGPAVESPARYKEYWVDDKQVTEEEHKLLYSIIKLKGLL